MEQDRKHILSMDCWCNPEVVKVEGNEETLAHRVASAEEAIKPLQVEEPATVEVNVVMGAQTRAIVRSALIHVRNAIKGSSRIEDDSQTTVTEIIDEELGKWPLGGEAEDTLAGWLFNRYALSDGRAWSELPEEDQAYWEHEAAAVRRAVGRGGFKRNDPLADTATMPDGAVLSTPINKLHQASNEATRDGGLVKSLRPLDLKNTQDIGEAIRIAVGAASTCWTNLMSAGVFKSEEALDIATQLEHHWGHQVHLALGQIGQRHQALAERLRSYRNAGHPTVSIQQAYSILAGTSTPEEYASALQPRPGNAAELGRPTNG